MFRSNNSDENEEPGELGCVTSAGSNVKGTVMLEPVGSLDTSLKIVESLIEVKENGSSAVVISNTGRSTCQLPL